MPKPKTHLDTDLLTLRVTDLRDRLQEAEADLALLTRLKDAEANAAKLRTDLQEASDSLAIALADRLTAERATRFAQFKDIQIAVAMAHHQPDNALTASYEVTVTQLVYDCDTRRNLPKEITYNGLAAIPSDAYSYLIECKPDAIPAIITALAPGDPAAALARYFQGVRRGHL